MKAFSTSLKSSIKHWFKKPVQFIFLIVGLALATALWSSIQILNSQAKTSYENAVKIISTAETDIIIPKNNKPIPIDTFAKLRRAGWPVTPIIEGKLPNQSSIIILGIDPVSIYQSGSFLNKLFWEGERFEEFIIKKNLGFASQKTINKLEKMSLSLHILPNETLAPNVLITDIGMAEEILGQKGEITRFELTGPGLSNRKILEKLNLRLVHSTTQGDLEQLTKSFHLNLSAFGLLGFIVGLFIVYSTLNLAFEQRKATYMTLRSIGVPVQTVYTTTLIEILGLALIGGIIGIFLGHWLAFILFPDVAATLNHIYGASLENRLVLSIRDICLALFMPVLGTLLISTNFILKLHKMSPQNLNSLVVGSKLYHKKIKLQLGAALILTGLIFVLTASSLGLFKSFLIIGLTIMVASILLPIILRVALSLLVSSIKNKLPLLHWFLSDSFHQVNRISLSLNALMLAAAVTIGVDNMVKSFKETFNIWLEKRLITEMYVRAGDQNTARKLINGLGNEHLVEHFYPITNLKINFKDQPTTLVGFEPADIYIKNWPLIKLNELTWGAIQNGRGVLINEQLYYKYGLGIGEIIELDSSLKPGKKVRHLIVGIYPDYGNRLGQIMMNINAFQEHYSNDVPMNFALKITSGSFESVSEVLMKKYGLSDAEIINQSTIKEFSTQIFNKTFSITNALSNSMIVVATLTILTTLITLSEIRLANLTPLWVLGITRFTLLKFELAQFVMLTLFTLLLAIPTGLLICHFLTSYVNVAAFGWKLPFQYYPKIWIQTLLIAALGSLLAILFPSILMFKNSPALMIRRHKNDT